MLTALKSLESELGSDSASLSWRKSSGNFNPAGRMLRTVDVGGNVAAGSGILLDKLQYVSALRPFAHAQLSTSRDADECIVELCNFYIPLLVAVAHASHARVDCSAFRLCVSETFSKVASAACS